MSDTILTPEQLVELDDIRLHHGPRSWYVDEITRLRQRVAALEAALQPFAEYGTTLPPGATSERPMNDAGGRDGRGDLPTVGDCRRAAGLLAEGTTP